MQRFLMTAAVLTALAGCADPLAQLPRLTDLDLAPSDPAAQALPTADEVAREGFFGTAATEAEPEVAPTETTATASPEPSTESPPARSGLMGWLRRAAPVADLPPNAPVVPAALPTEPEALPTTPEVTPALKPARRGLFARLSAPPKDTLDEAFYGDTLPFGEIARTCSARNRPLGRRVEAAGGYKLYDSNPRATGPRTYYITGFDDGCPRQLTASHVLLAPPSLYEVFHYGPAAVHMARGETDRAYENLKSQVCGVARNRPCGSGIRRMDRQAIFINAYPRADDNESWTETLIHDGAVLATSQKSSG